MHTFLYGRHGDRTTWDGSSCWSGDDAVWNCNFTHAEIPTYWPTQYRDKPVSMLFEKSMFVNVF